MKISIPNLKANLNKAVKNQRNIVESLENIKTNPSVSKEYYKNVGRLEVIEAVQELLDGNPVNFDLLLK